MKQTVIDRINMMEMDDCKKQVALTSIRGIERAAKLKAKIEKSKKPENSSSIKRIIRILDDFCIDVDAMAESMFDTAHYAGVANIVRANLSALAREVF